MHWKHEHQLMLRPQTPETCSQEESTTHTLKANINMDKRGGELRAHVERDETSLKTGESHGTTTGSAISLPCQVNEDVFTFCGSEGIKSCALCSGFFCAGNATLAVHSGSLACSNVRIPTTLNWDPPFSSKIWTHGTKKGIQNGPLFFDRMMRKQSQVPKKGVQNGTPVLEQGGTISSSRRPINEYPYLQKV